MLRLALVGIETGEHERQRAAHLAAIEVRLERASTFGGERAIEVARELAIVGTVARLRGRIIARQCGLADQNAQDASSLLSMGHVALSKHGHSSSASGMRRRAAM